MHDAFPIVVIDTGHNMAGVSGAPAIDTHFRRAFFDPLISQTCRVNQKMTCAKRYYHLLYVHMYVMRARALQLDSPILLNIRAYKRYRFRSLINALSIRRYTRVT